MTKAPTTGRAGVSATPDNKTRSPAGGGERRDDRRGKPFQKGGKNEAPAAPARMDTVTTIVEKGPGVVITKISQVNRTTHTPVSAKYFVTFEGHEVIEFAYLSAARDRVKEGPPATPAASVEAEPEAIADAVTQEAETVEA